MLLRLLPRHGLEVGGQGLLVPPSRRRRGADITGGRSIGSRRDPPLARLLTRRADEESLGLLLGSPSRRVRGGGRALSRPHVDGARPRVDVAVARGRLAWSASAGGVAGVVAVVARLLATAFPPFPTVLLLSRGGAAPRGTRAAPEASGAAPELLLLRTLGRLL